jgi:hypothetical protein
MAGIRTVFGKTAPRPSISPAAKGSIVRQRPQAEERAMAKGPNPARNCLEAATPAPPLTRELPAHEQKVRSRP